MCPAVVWLLPVQASGDIERCLAFFCLADVESECECEFCGNNLSSQVSGGESKGAEITDLSCSVITGWKTWTEGSHKWDKQLSNLEVREETDGWQDFVRKERSPSVIEIIINGHVELAFLEKYLACRGGIKDRTMFQR